MTATVLQHDSASAAEHRLHCSQPQVWRDFWGFSRCQEKRLPRQRKVLRESYQLETDNPNSEPHPAIQLVSAYIVERGLILEPYEVPLKTNEITALPAFIKQIAL